MNERGTKREREDWSRLMCFAEITRSNRDRSRPALLSSLRKFSQTAAECCKLLEALVCLPAAWLPLYGCNGVRVSGRYRGGTTREGSAGYISTAMLRDVLQGGSKASAFSDLMSVLLSS